MARTKAGQLARKFVGIGGDSSSDADDVEAPTEVRADEAGDVTVEAAESKRSGIYILLVGLPLSCVFIAKVERGRSTLQPTRSCWRDWKRRGRTTALGPRSNSLHNFTSVVRLACFISRRKEKAEAVKVAKDDLIKDLRVKDKFYGLTNLIINVAQAQNRTAMNLMPAVDMWYARYEM